ncbi:MAG: ankyrin repeat domain-containing protein [bacterium]
MKMMNILNCSKKNCIAIVLVVLSFTFLSLEGCTRTPESALKELNKLNIPYTKEQFLHYAQTGNRKVVELFLQAGMNVNATDENGQTALMLAASNGHIRTVKLLIKHGAYIDIADKSGNTALSLATKGNYMNIVKLLKKAEIDRSY